MKFARNPYSMCEEINGHAEMLEVVEGLDVYPSPNNVG